MQEVGAPKLVGILTFPDLRRVWISQVLSELGDWSARLALAVLVYDLTESAALTGLVTAASLLPWVGPGQLLATLGDHFPRRSVMAAADLVRAALFLLMILPVSPWLLILAAFAAGLATPPFESARSALIPELVPRKRYGEAVTLTQITYQVALLSGYLAGGGLVAAVGARAALAINAGSFVLSALVLLRVSEGRTVPARAAVKARLKEAALRLLRDTLLRRAVLLATIPLSLALVGEALVAVYVREELGGSDATIGLLAAAVPAGTIAAGLMAPKRGDHRRILRGAAAIALSGSLAAAALFLLRPEMPFTLLPFAALGVVFATIVPTNTVGGARLPDDIRSSAFGLISGVVTGSQALAVLAGGALAAYLGVAEASAVMLVPGILYCLFAVLRVPEMRVAAAPEVQDERREQP